MSKKFTSLLLVSSMLLGTFLLGSCGKDGADGRAGTDGKDGKSAYQEPVYTYYYYRDVSQEAMNKPDEQENISNVQKWVKYIVK